MKIIIDANVLFSALIKDSTTRRLILQYEGQFLFPEYIFSEMSRHKKMLLKKSGMFEEEFSKLLSMLLKKVVIIPNENLTPFRAKAYQISKDIDPDDSAFIACCLAYSNSFLWSDDKRLKEQKEVKVLNTKEAMNLILDLSE